MILYFIISELFHNSIITSLCIAKEALLEPEHITLIHSLSIMFVFPQTPSTKSLHFHSRSSEDYKVTYYRILYGGILNYVTWPYSDSHYFRGIPGVWKMLFRCVVYN